MHPRRARAATAGLAVLALGLAACGGGGPASGNSTPNSGQADRNAALRIGYVIPLAALDPHRTPSDMAAYSYLTPVYDRLTQMVSGENGAALAPMVATSWEFSEKGRAVTFILRDGVTFSDGEVLDAEAVKSTFDRAKNVPGSTVTGLLSMIDSVEVLDPS